MRSTFIFCLLILIFVPVLSGQSTGLTAADPFATPTPERSVEIKAEASVSHQRRSAAYAKLMEGQRYIWTARNTNSALARSTATRLAKEALQKAVELNPQLAEAYTALAELALRGTESDIEEAIQLSLSAISIDPDNFGGHKFLARLFTVKSGLGRERLNEEFTRKSIDEWKEVGRLDPQNAEAWAFLSSFYKELREIDLRIDALRKWLSSANTTDAGFYLTVMRGSDGLAPENAILKLGEALLENDMKTEALAVLSRAVSEDPDNLQAIDMLGRALENAEERSLGPAVEALRQAVYAHPDNVSLVRMLAETLSHTGDISGAAKVLTESIGKIPVRQGSDLFMTLGDIYSDANLVDEALKAYRKALDARGIRANEIVKDPDLGFTLLLISKMVQVLQKTGRISDAENLIGTSKGLFSVDNYVMDREQVSLMRATGRRTEALTLLRALRQKAPDDYNLIRKEAEILTDLGEVGKAVALIIPLIENKPAQSTKSIKYDDFVNRLFIAGLYLQAGRGAEARIEAEKAFEIASGDQGKQLATLKIASAQFVAGDYKSAEANLKQILSATPDNPMALNDLGFLYLRRGSNFEEALAMIEKAVSIDPRNPEYLDSLGLAHLKLGNLDQAERYLRKALRYDINSATVYEHLGDVLRQRGQENEAQMLWKKALVFFTNETDVERIESKLEN